MHSDENISLKKSDLGGFRRNFFTDKQRNQHFSKLNVFLDISINSLFGLFEIVLSTGSEELYALRM